MEDAAAWLLATIALFVLLLAIWSGAGVHSDALDQSRLQHGQRTQVEAVLLEDPPPGYHEADSEEVTWRSVHFADTSGSEHVADVLVAGRQPAGETVRLWVDRNDRVVPPPLTQTDAVVIGISAAIGIAALGAAVLASLWCGGYSTYATAWPGIGSGPRLNPRGAAETTGREFAHHPECRTRADPAAPADDTAVEMEQVRAGTP